MRRLLFIAYYFPPVGGAGTQRSSKFAKYLPENGFLPVVISADHKPSMDRWSPIDLSLQADLFSGVEVWRPECQQANLNSLSCRLHQKLRSVLGLPNRAIAEWGRKVVQTATKLHEINRFHAVYLSMSPFDVAHSIADFSNKYQIPLAMDLRDPWALDEMQMYPSSLHRKMEKNRMHRALMKADTIIMNTPESLHRLCDTFSDFKKKRVVTITNGFDADDFINQKSVCNHEHFTIVHTGYLQYEMGMHLQKSRFAYETMGRIVQGVDFLTRSHYYLLKAIKQWLREDPSVRSSIQIKLVGSLTAGDLSLVKQFDFAELIACTGYLPHDQTTAHMLDADLLFLPMHNLPKDHRATIVPGKTYEYMATGRPILAAVPEGDARDFLTRAGTGLVCQPDDLNGMVRILSAQYDCWRQGRSSVQIDTSYLKQFERRSLTAKLACEFTGLLNDTCAMDNY